MIKEKFTIPAAISLALDDIGWFRGGDDRLADDGEPSRTGMRRGPEVGGLHCLQDYPVVNEIGKRVNMKINMMFVIGEWDRKHILRNVPYACKAGKNWDTASFLDIEKAEEIRDFVNGAEYMELGVHGLLHNFWAEGKWVSGQEYFPPAGLVPPNGPNDPADFVPLDVNNIDPLKNPRELAPEWLLRAHFDAFMEIYNDWGFKGELRTFTSPSGPRNAGEADTLANVLKDYGVKYWHNGKLPSTVRHGIILNPKTGAIGPWEAYDMNPTTLPLRDPKTTGIIGGNWVNLLRYDPDCNMERVDDWANWIDRHGEVFGIMLARDVVFSHHQQLYWSYAKVEGIPGGVRIDLTEADALLGNLEKAPLYISIKKGEPVPSCQGGILTEYERRENHINYKLQRTGESVLILK